MNNQCPEARNMINSLNVFGKMEIPHRRGVLEDVQRLCGDGAGNHCIFARNNDGKVVCGYWFELGLVFADAGSDETMVETLKEAAGDSLGGSLQPVKCSLRPCGSTTSGLINQSRISLLNAYTQMHAYGRLDLWNDANMYKIRLKKLGLIQE